MEYNVSGAVIAVHDAKWHGGTVQRNGAGSEYSKPM